MDAAGLVESAGSGVERLHEGEEVMAVVGPRRPEDGAQSELLVVPAASVVPIPAGATLRQAATLPMNGLTALLALDMLSPAPGHRDTQGDGLRGADADRLAGTAARDRLRRGAAAARRGGAAA